jgi:hypothetical protein
MKKREEKEGSAHSRAKPEAIKNSSNFIHSSRALVVKLEIVFKKILLDPGKTCEQSRKFIRRQPSFTADFIIASLLHFLFIDDDPPYGVGKGQRNVETKKEGEI